MSKQFYLKQLSLAEVNSFCLIDGTLSGGSTPGQSEPGSDAIKGYSASPKAPALREHHCLVLYPGHSLVDSYPSTEMQLVYFAAPAD